MSGHVALLQFQFCAQCVHFALCMTSNYETVMTTDGTSAQSQDY